MPADAPDHLTIILGLIGAASGTATFLAFWIRFTTMINKAQADAMSAFASAKDAKTENDKLNKRIDENATKLGLQAEAFALYRERVAQDYVRHTDLITLETRLVTAIREASRASTEALHSLTQRLDRQLDKPRE
jgi:hypothetical protein